MFRLFLSHLDSKLKCAIKGAEYRGHALIGSDEERREKAFTFQ